MSAIITQIAIGSAQTAQQSSPQTGASAASISGAAALHKSKPVVDSEAEAKKRAINDDPHRRAHASFEDQDTDQAADEEERVALGSGGKKHHLTTA